MKKIYLKLFAVSILLILTFSACGKTVEENNLDAIEIELSDDAVFVDGKEVGQDSKSAVYVANDIIYYEDGKDFTYGEGSEKDAHSLDEATAHTVVYITEPGVYSLSGTLSLGQIAVDLGKDAKENPEAVVTLILNGVDITCELAPAVIFYNVYECGSDDAEQASKNVNTSKAGANVIIADGTTNNIHGAYVAKIYKPETVVLDENKSKVEDAKKLHKYDGAFYSRMSINVGGDEVGDGVLNIYAKNEGLDSELHLTINGGNINIYSANDGINTNEDGVSVTTINAGTLKIQVTGETGEGDGIDSNGWLVINGGEVIAFACSNSADAGIDSDMGIHINGGTVLATGHMLDRIEEGGQSYALFQVRSQQSKGENLLLKDASETVVAELNPENAYSILIYSSSEIKNETYTLWNKNGEKVSESGGAMFGPGMHGRPDKMPEGFEGMMPPEGFEGMMPPEGFEGMMPPEGFEGKMPPERGEKHVNIQ